MQHFKNSHTGFDYTISGSDIDTSVVETATQGLYKGRSVERFRQARPEWFERYMQGNDEDGFTVQPTIKSRIRFNQFNLFCPSTQKTKFDLVLLRNVLIYFKKTDQERVLSTIQCMLKPEGVLIIGESETLNNINTDFEYLAPTIYQTVRQSITKAA